MTLNLKFEYYPKIKSDVLIKSIEFIKTNKDKWDDPFFIDTKTHVDMEKIKGAADRYINDTIHNIIILGTGGSIQTVSAIKHLSKKKIYEITSSRAVELMECLENTTPDNSIVIPISRGGETLDINSTIGTFLKKGYNFLGLSSMGTMFDLLKNINCPILDVPDLSGRFAGSISNVGIVPAYIAGIDINQFLTSLKEAYDNLMNIALNPALEFAVYLFELYKKGYKVVFSMPYSRNLEGCVGLSVQEISESTGKDGKGLMGAYQGAPLCQHSVLEYLLGGTKGFVVPILWTSKNEVPDIKLDSSIDYVNNQNAQTIVNYQADATFQALIEQGVPCAKVSLEAPDVKNIAEVIAFIQSTVYYLCILLDVNWANNPKVVIGKKICNEALLKKTPEEEKKKIREIKAQEQFKNFF